ncbi:Sulfate-binding protein [Planktothrix sp. PCC 11201]|uniref:sulfate ABC transporter substrate-binding protein n=1 Tax=Planktothrix sp. PCC 11201 TaxID=1729650 RepID=UPI000912F830|nr:sulfate ABC transporter substrate-binding protein [Planktothrix sp. PCC 11201]SKB14297.1 Sulfate-binding protein [Planktothrix sp. PCC 11201]
MFHRQLQNRIIHHSFLFLFLVSLGLTLLLPACGQNPISPPVVDGIPRRPPIEISFVSYAVTRAAYAEIIPLFKEKWQKEHHQEVRIRQSYAGSSTQARAVINGLPADVVHLALALDTQKIQDAGLIQPGWEHRSPNHGIVAHSVGAIVTRAGNPKNIRTWSDLAKPGVSVITADPKTSGGARWNFLALWGAITQTGGTEAQALDFVTQVYKNVPVLAKDARESTDLFLRQNQGDVLINYENEMILATQEGLAKNTFMIIPDINISIDNPIAIVDKYVDRRGTREVAEAFVKFLFTPQAQTAFAKVGFRPLDPISSEQFPPIKQLFNAEDLGGWSNIQDKFFQDHGIFDQIQSEIRNTQTP